MAMETVTNYKCDRCGRSEIRDGVTIMTLTVRERTAGTPGQGKTKINKHVCEDNCLKIIENALSPVRRAGRPKAAANGGTKPATKATSTTGATKGGTKKSSAPVSRKITASGSQDTRADVVKAVRAITRTSTGGWAKGHNYRTERRMIQERESVDAK
jgi:hypothetical protein